MTKDKSILIKNIYYMLSYGFTTLKQTGYENMEKEDFSNIHNLFAAILSKGIGTQLKHGLHREYTSEKEDLVFLRGKIDVGGTIKNKFAKKQVICCEYDELSENNILNQILKTTVMMLMGHADVRVEHKNELKKKMLFFAQVDIINIDSIKWDKIRYNRNNQNYRMLMGLCQLVIDGMILTTEKGGYKIASFLDERHICRLYEKFILEYYSKEFPEIKVSASQIQWALDDGVSTALPVMQSDITLLRGDRVLIIEAKYYTHTMVKRYDKESLRSAHLYQIFSYVKNAEYDNKYKGKTVSGVLLYARTDEETQPNYRYKMSGNIIGSGTLDLNQDFEIIAKQLNDIVDEYL